jgi:hypothetical protein
MPSVNVFGKVIGQQCFESRLTLQRSSVAHCTVLQPADGDNIGQFLIPFLVSTRTGEHDVVLHHLRDHCVRAQPRNASVHGPMV